MKKQYLDAIEMLNIANQHAYCAEYLLNQNGEVKVDGDLTIDALLPILSLLHLAFELTLSAYRIHEHGHTRPHKNLMEHIEHNQPLGLSNEDLGLLKNLSKQLAFRKGIDPMLWQNQQQLHVFCEQLMALYGRLLDVMPIELQADYR